MSSPPTLPLQPDNSASCAWGLAALQTPNTSALRTRTATQAALEAIQAEEAALDESALPPAPREQVRRYFNELRKRFEKR